MYRLWSSFSIFWPIALCRSAPCTRRLSTDLFRYRPWSRWRAWWCWGGWVRGGRRFRGRFFVHQWSVERHRRFSWGRGLRRIFCQLISRRDRKRRFPPFLWERIFRECDFVLNLLLFTKIYNFYSHQIHEMKFNIIRSFKMIQILKILKLLLDC